MKKTNKIFFRQCKNGISRNYYSEALKNTAVIAPENS